MSKNKELDLEQLDKVTGGLNNNCAFFEQAQNKDYYNCCENCLYYNENAQTGKRGCSNPSKRGSLGGHSKGVVIIP